MEQYGEFTGEGLAIGIENSLGMIKNMAEKMSKMRSLNRILMSMPMAVQDCLQHQERI